MMIKINKNIQIYLGSLFAVLLAIVSVTTPVRAMQSPVGCNSNRLNLSITKDKTSVQQGDTITYTVTASNLDGGGGALACDIDDATATVTLPAPDGTPTGTIVTLATNASYPAGYPITLVGTAQYVVNVNPGVVDVVAQARVLGVLHDAPTDHTAEIIKTIGTAVVTPAPTEEASGAGGGPLLPNAGIPLP